VFFFSLRARAFLRRVHQVEVSVGGEVVRLKKSDLARAADPAASLAAAQHADDALFKAPAAKLGLSREELFVKVDLNGDGELTKDEVVAGHALLGVSPHQAAQLFDSLESAKRASAAAQAQAFPQQANASPVDAARRARGAALLAAKAQAAAARQLLHGGAGQASSSAGSARPAGLSKRTAAYSSAEPSASSGAGDRWGSKSSRAKSSEGRPSAPGALPPPSGGKTSGNTVDLLGLTVDDAQSILERVRWQKQHTF
jgi:hypothetical protein